MMPCMITCHFKCHVAEEEGERREEGLPPGSCSLEGYLYCVPAPPSVINS